jgi:pilus assembly protein CpaE
MSDLVIVGATDREAALLESSLSTVLAKGTAKRWNLDGKSGAGAAEDIAATAPAVVAIGSALDSDAAIALAKAIERADPLISTMLIAKPDVTILRRAMEAGVREIVDVAAKQRDAADALKRAFEAGALRRSSFDDRVTERLGAGEHPKETVLVDLDLQFGDAATALLLTPIHSMSDAAGVRNDELDAATLKVFLTRHSSELYVLCAPEEPAVGDSITADDVGRVLDVLSTEFRFVVIDTDAGFNEQTLAALERATDLVIVVDLDVPSVRGGRKLLKTLDALGLGAARRHVVLNRADSKVGLEMSEVAEVLGSPIDIALPSTRQAPVSFNEGRPLVTEYARTPIAKQILELAGRFNDGHRKEGRR